LIDAKKPAENAGFFVAVIDRLHLETALSAPGLSALPVAELALAERA
jgi:hypothetical protein